MRTETIGWYLLGPPPTGEAVDRQKACGHSAYKGLPSRDKDFLVALGFRMDIDKVAPSILSLGNPAMTVAMPEVTPSIRSLGNPAMTVAMPDGLRLIGVNPDFRGSSGPFPSRAMP